MKKILGILGISMIIAVSFFNMSSVVDANQNVDLASILQNANADSENGAYIYHSSMTGNYDINEVYWTFDINKNKYVECKVTGKVAVTTCHGTGTKYCEEKEEIWNYNDSCSNI
ncbi:hypothetical protein [Flavobacterium commune]|uniref:Uncharacterized protein n=1 Tax=Flavobacterium commune TaxID=1306519 RepID=A0A1D9PCP8_9FLAO|nr:hypothetical protein [Flavobacterium commune]APA00344.1 hypothetical protein BIW12_13420 [Flavobacterium commune]